MKTRFINDVCDLILEEPFTYSRLFKTGQEIVIGSKNYIVDRCNVNTDGSVDVYISVTRLTTLPCEVE